MPPLQGEGSGTHTEAQLAGEGAAGGGGGALSGSQPARKQRQSKQHRAGDYLFKTPFKEARGPG